MNENKGIMLTKIELTLEQSQQGVSNDVLAETRSIHNLSVFTKMNSDIEERRHRPSDAMHNPSQTFKFSQQILVDRYGQDKNHKKTVKNGQTRTRGMEEHKRSREIKPKSKLLVNYGSTKVNHKKTKPQKLPNQSFKFQKFTQMILEV
ncbi:hypothetical protein Tco_1357166 [Tanacetum coccineum]